MSFTREEAYEVRKTNLMELYTHEQVANMLVESEKYVQELQLALLYEDKKVTHLEQKLKGKENHISLLTAEIMEFTIRDMKDSKMKEVLLEVLKDKE